MADRLVFHFDATGHPGGVWIAIRAIETLELRDPSGTGSPDTLALIKASGEYIETFGTSVEASAALALWRERIEDAR